MRYASARPDRLDFALQFALSSLVMIITGVILAAGTSSRMGPVNKLLLEYGKHTIVEETLTKLLNSKVHDVIVITGFDRERVESVLAGNAGRVRFVYNSRYQDGRAESIKRAIEHIDNRAEAALFMVADKPTVTTELIDRAIARFEKDRPAVLHVETPGGRGHPIIFARTVFEYLLALKGDFVGNDIVLRYSDNLVRLNDEKLQIDVDSEADYRMLLKEASDNTDR